MKTIKTPRIPSLILLVLLSIFITKCKPTAVDPVIPKLTTSDAGNITANSASSGGTISEDGGASVTARGVCWSTAQNPTTTNSKTTDGTGTGSFTSSMTGLSAATTYYVKAYATNSAGTSYGNQVTFTTGQNSSLATVTTAAVTNITTTTATLGGIVTADGNAAVTERGTIVSANPNPTTALNKFPNGTGTGSFTSNITGFTANTTYYVRAYAINSQGTSYGNEVSFKTNAATGGTVTDSDGNVYSSVTIGTQVWMTTNLKSTKYNDGTSIPMVSDNTAWANLTTPGYCWYNNTGSNKDPYGALYNWYTVNSTKLCPAGWHVPTKTEWETLTNFLGDASAGGKLKEAGTSHWLSPNTGATNETGFTALPGGSRDTYGTFGYIGENGGYWSSTEILSVRAAWTSGFQHIASYVGITGPKQQCGFSVRCMKN